MPIAAFRQAVRQTKDNRRCGADDAQGAVEEVGDWAVSVWKFGIVVSEGGSGVYAEGLGGNSGVKCGRW